MHIQRIASLALMAGTVLLAACDTARRTEEARESGTCVTCHGGTDNDTGAPPKDLRGETTGPSIGAHTRHLQAGVACESCHRVPARVDDPGHLGGDRVVFGAAARQDGATPTYVPNPDPASLVGGTCNSTYCHGGTMEGGSLNSPTWGGPRVVCGSCHGIPPPSHGTAPVVAACHLCHPETVDPGLILKAGGKHIDGAVQVDVVAACTRCHGDATRVTAAPLDKAAPPVDTSGLSAGGKVGAHQAHLVEGPLAKAIACTECHAVPFDVAHASEPNPVVVFNGPLGTAGGATPTYANGTCSGVYCHGAGTTPLSGGTLQAPSWAGTDQAACGTCHAFLPPAPHPQADRSNVPITLPAQCSQCHSGTVNEDGTMFVQNGLHVNGVVDAVGVHGEGWLAAAGALQPHGLAANFHDPAWSTGIDSCRRCHGTDLNGVGTAVSCNACHAAAGKASWQTDCTFCHGEPNRTAFPAAPPVDTLGRTAATERGVGAHQAHLLGKQPTGAISDGVACADCHDGQPYTDIAHVNGTPAVSLKRPGTTTVAGTFDVAAGSCASTYCHGGFRNGKAANAPAWTATGGQGACDTCHAPQTGADAGSYSDRHRLHLALASGLACAVCHVDGYAPAATPPTVNSAAHVNGAVDLNTQVGWSATAHTCTTVCHGGAASPPWY